MSRFGGCLVAFGVDGRLRKLCRIFFGRDGSYYVTAPYHPLGKALLFKATVNYALQETTVPFKELLDSASFDDDERVLKLAHHPDGFVQFSGDGVTSGRDAEGNIRGVGLMSWPLVSPVRGPAFGVTIAGVDQFEEANSAAADLVVFREQDVAVVPGWNVVVLEGHYFPPSWRRFVRRLDHGTSVISVVHPAKAVLDLRVVFAGDDCEWPGFIGLEVYTEPDVAGPSPRFILSGPTGAIRQNDKGETLGDGIYAAYPPPVDGRRSVNYALHEVPGSEGEFSAED
jgi:hypothetical protein